jgi:hypothetical protein
MIEELVENISKKWGLPGWIAGAAAVALVSSPTVRKTARRLAVRGLSAVLMTAVAVRQAGTKAKEEWQSLVQEASLAGAADLAGAAGRMANQHDDLEPQET